MPTWHFDLDDVSAVKWNAAVKWPLPVNPTSCVTHLLRSTRIATMFLDDALLIRGFTPAISEIYGLLETDVGRPLEQFVPLVEDMPPIPDPATIRDGHVIEDTVQARSGKAFIRRILPYQSHTGGHDGIVVTFTDVTELRASEAQLASLMNSTAEGIYGIDLAGNCTFANAACARLLGYDSPNEFLGVQMHQLIHHTRRDGTAYPDDECHIYQAYRSGLQKHVDDEVFWRADGSSFPAEYWSHPQIRDGETVGCVVAFMDITDRKRAEFEIASREAHLRRVIDHQLGLVGVLETDGTLVEANATALLAAGLTREDVIGKKFWECYWWNYDDAVANRLRDSCRQALAGHTVRYDEVIRIAGDERMTVDFMVRPVTDAAGEVTHLIPSGVDISDRIQVETLHRETAVRLESMFESAMDGMIAIDRRGLMSSVNPAAVKLFGYAADEMIGMNVNILMPDPWHTAHDGYLAAYLRSGVGKIIGTGREVRGLRKDGSEFDLELQVSEATAKGETIFVGTLRDITKRKRHEANLAFLADLQSSFHRLQSIEGVLHSICKQTAEYLGLSHCCFVETDDEATVANVIFDHVDRCGESLVGRHKLGDFHSVAEQQAFRQGNAVVVNDTQSDVDDPNRRANFHALEIGAACNVAFVSDGGVKFILSGHKRSPYVWRSDEIELLQDVTQRLCVRIERARAEVKLAEAKARLDLSLEVGEVAPWSWNMQTNNVVSNPTLNRLFGFDECTTPTLAEFIERIDSNDRQRVSTAVDRSTQRGEMFDEEYKICWPDGKERHVRARGSVRVSDNGRVQDFFGVVVDITDRKRRELELVDREAHLRRVINNQLGLVGVIGRDGKLLEVDKRSMSIAGLTPEDVIGKHFADCAWWTYDKAVSNKMRESMNRAFAGEVVRYDVELYAAGLDRPNSRLMIDFMIAPVFDQHGNVEYLIPSGVDISERHAAEQKLLENERRLSMALRAGEMAAWEWTPEKSVWEPALFRILGVEQQPNPTSELFFKCVHPEDLPGLRKAWKRATAGMVTMKLNFGSYDRTVRSAGSQERELSSEIILETLQECMA